MKILIIIISYKDEKNLKECLESLDSGFRRNDKDSFNVYVHNNSDKNLGFAGGMNVALKKRLVEERKVYDWVWLLNPDCTVEFKGIYGGSKGIVRGNSKQLFVNDVEYDVFSPVVYDEHGKIWFAGGKINKWTGECYHKKILSNTNKYYPILTNTNKTEGKREKVKDKMESKNEMMEWVSGCSMFIRPKVFEKIGLFDEKFFLFYEDVDFCLRARDAGFRIGVVGIGGMWKEGIERIDGLDGLRVIHKVSQSVKKLTNKYEIEMKSKFYLLKKHGQYFWPTAYLISQLRYLKHKLVKGV